VLDGLFVTPAVIAIAEALASTKAEGKLAVVGHAKLAQAMRDANHEVLPVGISQRAAKRLTNALADLSSIGDRTLAAVIGVQVATDDGWEIMLQEWSRVVRDGGMLVFVDRSRAPEASRRALCAGLSEIEQRHAGRAIVTSGVVSHL
jgi:hypothetical protein